MSCVPRESSEARARSNFPSVVAVIVIVLAGLLLQGPVPHVTQPLGSSKPAVERWSKAERRLMNRIDNARERRGLRPLRWKRTVGHVSREHSSRMRARRAVFHSNVSKTLEDFSWTIAGQNVGSGPSAKKIFRAFMRSQAHRDLILERRFRRAAVGARWKNGIAFVTVHFLG